jgi:chromosome segregation ATPase
MNHISLPATLTGLLLATVAFTAAQAQTRPTRLVTRDELRVCMNTEPELLARKQAVDARNKQQREEAAAIRAEADELKAEHEKLEEDQKPMDKFERKVKVHNARVKTAQAAAESFRGELETLNKSLQAYNEQCGAISFSTEDKEAILKERAAK